MIVLRMKPVSDSVFIKTILKNMARQMMEMGHISEWIVEEVKEK